MKICRHCGTENADDAVFCQSCGAKLTEADNASPEAGSQKTEQSPLPFENHSETQTNQAQAQTSQPWSQANQAQGQTSQPWSQANQAQGQTSQPQNQTNQTQTQTNQAQSQTSQPWDQANQAQGQPSNFNQTFQKHKKPFIGVICAACVAIVCLLLYLFMPRTINLNKYVKVKTKGYDGYGTATVELDTDKLEKDFAGKIKLTSEGKKAIKQYQGLVDLADLFGDSSDIKGSKEEKLALALVEEYLYTDGTPVELNKTSSLSNGQSIRCKFSKSLSTKALSKYCRVRLKYKNFDYKVSGLKKVTKKDLKLNLTFTGMDGEGSIDWSSLPKEASYFDVDSEDELSNGDEVTLTLKKGEESNFIKEFGYLPKQQTYTVKVSGLEAYIESLSDLKDDRLAEMQKQAQDEITANFASSSDESVSDLKYAGAYLLTNKDDDGWYSHNMIYIVYSGTVSSPDGSFNPTTVYLPVRFSNVTDGSENLSGDVIGDSEVDTTDGWGNYIDGYTNGTEMYNDIIAQNVDDWNHEVSDGLKGFGE